MNIQVFRAMGGFGGGGDLTPEYKAVMAQMTVQPTEDEAYWQNWFVSEMKKKGYWTKLDVFYFCGVHNQADSYLNWKNPGTFTLYSPQGAKTFTKYKGIKAATTAYNNYFMSDFVPETNCTQATPNDISILMGLGDNYGPVGVASCDMLIHDTHTSPGPYITWLYHRNRATGIDSFVTSIDEPNATRDNFPANVIRNPKRHYAISKRPGSVMQHQQINNFSMAVGSTTIANALPNNKIYLGAGSGANASQRSIMYFGLGKSFTEVEINDIQNNIFDPYFAHFGTNIFGKRANMTFVGHSFFTTNNGYINSIPDIIYDKVDGTKFNLHIDNFTYMVLPNGAHYDADFPVGTTNRFFVIYTMTREVRYGEVDAWWPQLRAFLLERAQTQKVIVFTVTPCFEPAYTAEMVALANSERIKYNGYLLNDLANETNIYIVNTDLIANTAISTNYQDGLHPTQELYIEIADAASTIINGLLV